MTARLEYKCQFIGKPLHMPAVYPYPYACVVMVKAESEDAARQYLRRDWYVKSGLHVRMVGPA